jgi:hypothetical protein
MSDTHGADVVEYVHDIHDAPNDSDAKNDAGEVKQDTIPHSIEDEDPIIEIDINISEVKPRIDEMMVLLQQDRPYANVLKKRIDEIGVEAFRQNATVYGSFDHTLYLAITEFSEEARRVLDYLDVETKDEKSFVHDKVNFSGNLMRDNAPLIAVGRPRPKQSNGTTSTLDGEAGRNAFVTHVSGSVYKIPLLNSGFTITISTPSPNILYKYVMSIGNDTTEYGRRFGQTVYSFADHFHKSAVADLLKPRSGITLGSNLSGWSRGNNLISHISILDVPAIMARVGDTLYRDGYDFKHMCTNCNSITTKKIRVSKLVVSDFTRIPESQFKLVGINPDAEITPAQLGEYKKLISPNRLVRLGTFGIELKVPTLEEFLSASNRFIGSLNAGVFGEYDAQSDSAAIYNDPLTYAPWVSKCFMYASEGDTVPTNIGVGAEVIEGAIMAHPERDYFITAIKKYIDEMQVSRICYPTFACPSCGHTEDSPSGYVTVDPLTCFFTMAVQSLQTS